MYSYIFCIGFDWKIWLLAIIYLKYGITRLFWAITANYSQKRFTKHHTVVIGKFLHNFLKTQSKKKNDITINISKTF